MGNGYEIVPVKALGSGVQLRVKGDELLRGDLRLVRAMVRVPATEVTEIWAGKGKAPKTLLSPDGADRLNRIAGLQVIELTGERYRRDIRDDRKGGLDLCVRSAVALGRDQLGNLTMAGPMTISYSPRAYMMHSLTKQANDSRKSGVRWDADPKPEGSKPWKHMSIDGDLGLWVDLSDVDVGRAIEAYAQSRKFAERLCMGILRRNLFCSHPGGADKHPMPAADGNGYMVPVTAYIPQTEQAAQEMQDMVKRISESDDPRDALPEQARVIDAPMTEAEDEFGAADVAAISAGEELHEPTSDDDNLMAELDGLPFA